MKTKQSMPHSRESIRATGASLDEANAVLIFMHGRGASAGSILTLAQELTTRDDIAFLAPQAENYTWYPNRFLAPISANEPWLTGALQAVDRVVETAINRGIPTERIGLLGFSQGACLTLEYAARHPKRYGAVIGFSGGLIGDDDGIREDLSGNLAETPVFLGCSDQDFHIPESRVHQADMVLSRMEANVTKRIYQGMGHTINADELEHARRMVAVL